MRMLFLSLVLLVAACAKTHELDDNAYCLAHGYQMGTEAYAICRSMLAQERASRRAAGIAIWSATQPVYRKPLTCQTYHNTLRCN